MGSTFPAAAQGRAGGAPGPASIRRGLGGQVLVFEHVTVIDVEHGRHLPDQRVVVVGTRIRALGSRSHVALPPGARTVDAWGQYLIPGLWDVHAHPVAGGPERGAKGLYAWLLANGITGLRDAGSATPLDTFRVWKQAIRAGRRVSPRLIVSGPSIVDTFGSRWATNDPAKLKLPGMHCLRAPCDVGHFAYVMDSADARHLVDSLRTAGADILKFYGPSRRTYFALAAEARRLGIPFGGHVNLNTNGGPWPDTLDGLTASDSGARILDHELWVDNVCGWGLDSAVLSLARCAAVATHLRQNHTWMAGFGVWLPLPDSVWRRAYRYDETWMAYDSGRAWHPLSAAARRALPTGAELAAALPDSVRHGRGCRRALLNYAADLPWVPGPDYVGIPTTIGVHGTLLSLMLCGVPPWWVLRAATLESARAVGLGDSLGTVAAGKVADLVLLEGDPLADIWNVTKIAAVVANGRYFDRAALNRVLSAAAAEWRQVHRLEQRERQLR